MSQQLIGEFEARRVERMLRQLFGGKLGRDETLRVLGGVQEHEWLQVSWELANEARSWVYEVQARVSCKQQGLRQQQAIELLYDLLGAQFDELLSGDHQPFTGPKWEQVEFAGKVVFLRGQVVDQAAENKALALLEPADPMVVRPDATPNDK
jgi:hypothetical protein